MLKHYIILPITLTLFSLLSAGAPDTLWTRTYGRVNGEHANKVLQTSDEGFIIVGSIDFWIVDSLGYLRLVSDLYLIRTNYNGDTLWTKMYGGDSLDIGNSIQQTADGGFIITGETNSFGNGDKDVYLIRTNSNGDTLWTRTYGGDTTDIGYSVQQTSDSGFIIAGETWSYGAGWQDVYLIRTNKIGDTIFTKTIGGERSDGGQSIHLTENGGFIITGSTASYGAGFTDVYLIRINHNGDTLWTKTYGNQSGNLSFEVDVTSDSGFVIIGDTRPIGATNLHIYLIRTNMTGDTLWTKTFCEDSSHYGWGYSVQQTSDGGFILAGKTASLDDSDEDVYVIRTNSIGDTLWTKILDNSLRDKAYSIQQTTDGGYIIAGETDTSTGGKSDVYLIRLAKDTTVIQQEIPSNFIKPNNFIVSYNNGNISIRYTIPYSSNVKLEAYDIKGKLVKVITDKFMQKGSYSVRWDSCKYGSGVYYIKLSTGSNTVIQKAIVIK